MDTHVFRIARRLGGAKGQDPKEVEMELRKLLPQEHWIRINFQLIYHGRAICTARKAYCEKCPLEQWCMKTLEEKKGSRKKAGVGKMPTE